MTNTMRDTYNRYVKSLSEVGPEWSRGCDSCEFGIVVAPDILAAWPLYEGRAVQAADGMIVFCGCKAGDMYGKLTSRVYYAMQESLREAIRESIAAQTPMPTVHA